jgi:hypothetical protein
LHGEVYTRCLRRTVCPADHQLVEESRTDASRSETNMGVALGHRQRDQQSALCPVALRRSSANAHEHDTTAGTPPRSLICSRGEPQIIPISTPTSFRAGDTSTEHRGSTCRLSLAISLRVATRDTVLCPTRTPSSYPNTPRLHHQCPRYRMTAGASHECKTGTSRGPEGGCVSEALA